MPMSWIAWSMGIALGTNTQTKEAISTDLDIIDVKEKTYGKIDVHDDD